MIIKYENYFKWNKFQDVEGPVQNLVNVPLGMVFSL